MKLSLRTLTIILILFVSAYGLTVTIQAPNVYATDTLYEYYAGAMDSPFGVYGSFWLAQTFTTAGSPHTVTSIKVGLCNTGAATTIEIAIRATSGGLATGSDLTTGSHSTSGYQSCSVNPSLQEISVSSYVLAASTLYAIIVRAPSAGLSDRVGVSWQMNEYSSGTALESSNGGSSWQNDSQQDIPFYIYGSSTSTTTTSTTTSTTSTTSSTTTTSSGPIGLPTQVMSSIQGGYIAVGATNQRWLSGQRYITHNAPTSDNYPSFYLSLHIDSSNYLGWVATSTNTAIGSQFTYGTSGSYSGTVASSWSLSSVYAITTFEGNLAGAPFAYAVYKLDSTHIAFRKLVISLKAGSICGGYELNSVGIGDAKSISTTAAILDAGIQAELESNGVMWVSVSETLTGGTGFELLRITNIDSTPTVTHRFTQVVPYDNRTPVTVLAIEHLGSDANPWPIVFTYGLLKMDYAEVYMYKYLVGNNWVFDRSFWLSDPAYPDVWVNGPLLYRVFSVSAVDLDDGSVIAAINTPRGIFLWTWLSWATNPAFIQSVSTLPGPSGAEPIFASFMYDQVPVGHWQYFCDWTYGYEIVAGYPTTGHTCWFTDVSTFRMPNGQYGLFYSDGQTVYVAYHLRDWSSTTFSEPYAITSGTKDSSTPGTKNQAYMISADAEGNVAGRVSSGTIQYNYPTLPMVYQWDNQNNRFYQTAFWIPQIVVTQTQSFTSTQYTTTTETVEISQTQTFLSGLIFSVMLVLIPAGLLGALLGFPFFMIGAVAGSLVGVYEKQMPLWVTLAIIVIFVLYILSARSSGESITISPIWSRHSDEEESV